ncbi:hypothetical protein B5F38_03600 [Barnesiella sp. An22]|nr:hypothetical protein B5F38_03600 [Barnesiella sp. An22]
MVLLAAYIIFAAQLQKTVEGFGCLQPRKKMLKLRYGVSPRPVRLYQNQFTFVGFAVVLP